MSASAVRPNVFRPPPSTKKPGATQVKFVRPSHWLALMSVVVAMTASSLLLSETHYLVGDPTANAVRFGSLALLVVMMGFRPRDRVAVRKPRLFDGAAVAFSVLAFASVLYSADPSTTLLRATSAALLYLAVFWTLWFYADVVGGRKITDILMVCVAIVFFAGILSVFTSTGDAWLSARFRGVLANPNAVGMLTILFMPFAVVRAMRRKSLINYFLILVMLVSVVLSGSRNGVMTTSIAMAFFALRIRAWKTGVLLAALAAATYLAMPDYAPAPGISARPINHILSSDDLAEGGGRVEAWAVAIPIIKSKILLGHGFGTEDLIFKGMKFRIHRGDYIHNSYLGLTYQLGIVGSLLVFVPLIGLLIYRLLGHGSRSPQTAAYETLLFGGLIAAFFESWIYSAGNAFAFPFWTCVMLLTRAALGARDPDELPTTPARAAAIVRPPSVRRTPLPAGTPRNALAPGVSRQVVVQKQQNVRRFDPPPPPKG